MCELWGDLDSAVAARWYRALPVQRLRALPQNERAEPAAHQAQKEAGKFLQARSYAILTIGVFHFLSLGGTGFDRKLAGQFNIILACLGLVF